MSEETVQRFELLVPAGQRSQTVERLIRESIDEIERAKLRQEIAEGLEEMADVHKEAIADWAPTDLDGWPKH